MGLTYFRDSVGDCTVEVYGMVGDDRTRLPKDRFGKAATKGRYLTRKMFLEWIERLRSLTREVDDSISNAEVQAIEPIHDAKRWSKELTHNAESIVHRTPGEHFRDKLRNCAPEIRTIVKSARILGDIFEAMRLYNNPDAAQFQDKEEIEVYRVIDKIVSILQARSDGQDTGPIRLKGSGYGSYSLRQSFQMIPLALIQNAQQYLAEGEVLVCIEETYQGMKVSVENCGPLITEHERDDVLQRGSRGVYGRDWKRDSTGLGLYIARVAANANDITLDFSSTPLHREFNGIPIANNCFWFVVGDSFIDSETK